MYFKLFIIFKFLLKNMKCAAAYVSGIVCKSTLNRSILDYQNQCQGKINREMSKISHKLINASSLNEALTNNDLGKSKWF